MHAPAVWLRARRCVVGCPLGHSLYARVSCARTQADRACFNRPLQGGPRRLRGGHRHLHQVPLRVNLVATWCPHDCLPLGATRAATTTKTIQKNLSLRMVRPGVVRFHRTRSIHPECLRRARRAARTLCNRLFSNAKSVRATQLCVCVCVCARARVCGNVRPRVLSARPQAVGACRRRCAPRRSALMFPLRAVRVRGRAPAGGGGSGGILGKTAASCVPQHLSSLPWT